MTFAKKNFTNVRSVTLAPPGKMNLGGTITASTNTSAHGLELQGDYVVITPHASKPDQKWVVRIHASRFGQVNLIDDAE